jgi:hypothetical protein
MTHIGTETELDRFVLAFEAGTIPRSEWTHAAHLTIAGCYAVAYNNAQALIRLRTGIRYLNDCHGTQNSANSGYHETLTCFWLAVVLAFLNDHRAAHGNSGRLEAIRALVNTFADQRDLFRDYYSFDVVGLLEARQSWVAPDKRTLTIPSFLKQ